MANMTYNGKQLLWSLEEEGVMYSFKATSGFVDKNFDYRFAKFQCMSNFGPIPEGIYAFSLMVDHNPAELYEDEAGCHLHSSWRIQSIPRGMAAGKCDGYLALWGYNRVRLEPYDLATMKTCSGRRSGFYLHDSTKGHTQGCIETETRFFTILRGYAKKVKLERLTINVKYSTQSTYHGN